jgi:hypothetical protein
MRGIAKENGSPSAGGREDFRGDQPRLSMISIADFDSRRRDDAFSELVDDPLSSISFRPRHRLT